LRKSTEIGIVWRDVDVEATNSRVELDADGEGEDSRDIDLIRSEIEVQERSSFGKEFGESDGSFRSEIG